MCASQRIVSRAAGIHAVCLCIFDVIRVEDLNDPSEPIRSCSIRAIVSEPIRSCSIRAIVSREEGDAREGP